jgi:DNA (cytosine-5)-methyltransferase 1
VSFRFVDLFAGLGGFHLALNHLGGKCVFASEIDENLRAMYLANHGLMPAGDITKIRSEQIPEHDLLAAGFPCQPFSKAGAQKGFHCADQGNLFFEIERILATRQPKYVLLENVPNILSHDGGRTINEIVRRLNRLGYDIDLKILSPHEFGVPQHRQRAYIVGALSGLHRFRWPQQQDCRTDVRDVLDKSPREAKPISSKVLEALALWDQIIKTLGSENIPGHPHWAMEWGATYPYEERTPHSYILTSRLGALRKYRGNFGVPLKNCNTYEEILAELPPYSLDQMKDFPSWKKNFISLNRNFYESNKKYLKPFVKKLRVLHPSLQKLEWNLTGEKSEIFNQLIQLRASGIRVKTTKYAPSLVAINSSQVPIVGWERRYMSLRECMRLQSLESLKWMPDGEQDAYKALGNAVNVKVVYEVASSLIAA